MSQVPETIADGWYVYWGKTLMGPYSVNEIREMILAGQVRWIDFMAHPKVRNGQWTRVFETQLFDRELPTEPVAPLNRMISMSRAEKDKEGGRRSSTSEITKTGSSRAPRGRDESPIPGLSREFDQAANLELETGAQMIPDAPPKESKGSSVRSPWYVQFHGSKFGPFQVHEVEALLENGQLSSSFHVWRKGYDQWVKVGSQSEFQTLIHGKAAVKGGGAGGPNKRRRARFPMMATIHTAADEQKTKVLGVCRDISVLGMQVLMTPVPGPVGSRHGFHVEPSPNAQIPPFHVYGTIIRIREENDGFAFRFDDLPAMIATAIEEFSRKLIKG